MIGTTSIIEQSCEAAAFISSQFPRRPKYGIVLGTGAGVLAASIQPHALIDYRSIPNFQVSTALGHKGRLVCGTLADQAVIAMDGRFHLYEGHDLAAASLPIRVMRELGVEVLIVTNASGGLNPKFNSGELMAITSHIDMMCRTSAAACTRSTMQRPSFRTDVYDRGLIDQASRCARRNDFVLHQGVYAALLGPNYETRAEYRMLRRIGADVVGMSTVPEVVVAASLGLQVLGLSVVTNVAKPDILAPTSGQQVVDAAAFAAKQIEYIVMDIFADERRKNNFPNVS